MKMAIKSTRCNVKLYAAYLTEMTDDGATGGPSSGASLLGPFTLSNHGPSLASPIRWVPQRMPAGLLCEPNKDIYENLTKFLQCST